MNLDQPVDQDRSHSLVNVRVRLDVVGWYFIHNLKGKVIYRRYFLCSTGLTATAGLISIKIVHLYQFLMQDNSCIQKSPYITSRPFK